MEAYHGQWQWREVRQKCEAMEKQERGKANEKKMYQKMK